MHKIKRKIICGISNKMDGFKDKIFGGFNKINEQNFKENDLTKEEVDMNNN